MKYEVLQRSHYKYSLPVKQSINQCIFMPLTTSNQKLIAYEQNISPNAESSSHQDYWGNEVNTFYIWEPHHELIVETRSILELSYANPFIELTEVIEKKMTSISFRQQFAEYLMPTTYTSLSKDIIESITNTLDAKHTDAYSFVHRLNKFIYEDFAYVPGSTHVKTVASEAYEKRSGVCQDFSHVMLAICRSQGIPARYVSGYIYGGEDAAMRGDSQTHAWVDVYFPNYGWVGFDPTNNRMALNQHICVATGRDYADITPLKGVYIGSGMQELNVSISVSRIKDDVKIGC